jgi:hypothetical protein
MDIGYNNPSKQQDSIYSEASFMGGGAHNESLMMDSLANQS